MFKTYKLVNKSNMVSWSPTDGHIRIFLVKVFLFFLKSFFLSLVIRGVKYTQGPMILVF